MAPRLDDLAQPGVNALQGVGGVDHTAHLWRERKERDHVRPGAAPGRGHRRELLAPGAGLERTQLGLGRLSARGAVDGLQGRGQRPSVLPARVVQAAADQVHDAGLQRRGRVDGRQGPRPCPSGRRAASRAASRAAASSPRRRPRARSRPSVVAALEARLERIEQPVELHVLVRERKLLQRPGDARARTHRPGVKLDRHDCIPSSLSRTGSASRNTSNVFHAGTGGL